MTCGTSNTASTRLDGGAEPRLRAKTAGGDATAGTACLAGIEVARTEVDNLRALEAEKQQ